MPDTLAQAADAALFDLTVAIQPTRRAWMQAVGAVLASSGLSISLATVVLVVSRSGPRVPQSTVALEVGVNPAALVRTLDQGEVAGLLARRAVEGDRRIREIELLPAGRACAQRIEESLAALRRTLLGGVSAADVETAIRVLHLLESAAATYAKEERQA